MASEISWMSALELKRCIAAKEISPVDAVEASLQRLHATEDKLNAFVTLTEDVAREAAHAAEDAVMNGAELGPLCGIPVSVKDLIAMGGVKATFGSRTMADNVAAADAPSVARLRAAGACIVGKTTTSEFGCKAVGDCTLSGITRNPWNLEKTPGASSSGAGASVAAGVTPFGLGTDGGGSVRIPGAFCSLFAIKPQFARIPVFPTSATTTLAHVGPMSRTVRDGALLLNVTSGFDARDPFAVAEPVPDFLAACDKPVKGLKAAWSPTLGYAKPDPEVVALCEEAVKALEAQGCEVELVETVIEEDPEDIWATEFYPGVGGRLRDVLENEPGMLDPAVAERLARSLKQPLVDHYTSVFARYDLRERMRVFFEGYDLLLSPTLPVPPFDTGLNAPPQDPDADIVGWVRYTYPFNMTGTPAATVPAGFTKEGLPVGLQIVAGALNEADVFAAAAAIEEARPWADRKPSV
ncbi:MAG: amidase family protein [Hyphomicrobiaceae bacterium]|nr:amidase family protein [Hyphomicrobiaceae bacterium]